MEFVSADGLERSCGTLFACGHSPLYRAAAMTRERRAAVRIRMSRDAICRHLAGMKDRTRSGVRRGRGARIRSYRRGPVPARRSAGANGLTPVIRRTAAGSPSARPIGAAQQRREHVAGSAAVDPVVARARARAGAPSVDRAREITASGRTGAGCASPRFRVTLILPRLMCLRLSSWRLAALKASRKATWASS